MVKCWVFDDFFRVDWHLFERLLKLVKGTFSITSFYAHKWNLDPLLIYFQKKKIKKETQEILPFTPGEWMNRSHQYLGVWWYVQEDRVLCFLRERKREILSLELFFKYQVYPKHCLDQWYMQQFCHHHHHHHQFTWTMWHGVFPCWRVDLLCCIIPDLCLLLHHSLTRTQVNQCKWWLSRLN